MNLKKTLLFAAIVALSDAADTGPVGPIKIYEVTDCDEDLNTVSLKQNLKTDSKKVDSLTLEFSLAEDLEDDTFVSVVVDKYDGSSWQEGVYEVEQQPFFKFLNDFIPTIWKDYREKVVPYMMEFNKIRAGDYKIEDFQATWKDINTPQVYYGRLRSNVILSKGDEDILCLKVDVECFEPEDE